MRAARRRAGRLLGAVSVVLLAAVGGAGQAQALSSAEAIAQVNALRAANGIPSDVADDPALAAGCRAHAHYAVVNGGFDPGAPHGETPGKPAYTAEGDAAAGHSVLAGTTRLGADEWWRRSGLPWASAPAHLSQILDPSLARSGYGDEAGYLCLQTLAEPRRSLALRAVYTFPGDGTAGVPFEERAVEADSTGAPSVPGDAVGLPIGSTTGPYLMVFTTAFSGATLSAVTVTGPSGPVDVAMTGHFVIPRRPLEPAVTYTAEATIAYEPVWCGANLLLPEETFPPCPDEPLDTDGFAPRTRPITVVHRWSFTTAPRPKPIDGRTVRSARPAIRAVFVDRRGRVWVQAFSRAPRLVVTLRNPDGRTQRPRLRGRRVTASGTSAWVSAGARVGRWHICVTARGGGFPPARSCANVLLNARGQRAAPRLRRTR